jgi:hypothetical protein
VRRFPDPPQPTTTTISTPSPATTTNPPPEFVQFSIYKTKFVATMDAIRKVLAARLMLGIALGGAIYLTVLAGNDPYKLLGLFIYCLFSLGGTIWLACRE